MLRDKIQKEQPIAFQTITNAIYKNKCAHAYLFTGVKGTPKKEVALWLAQNLLCQNKTDGLACEVCDECRRIIENKYADLIILDGTESFIKKDSILDLQEKFSKTALEKSGKKFYILDMAENATTEALNSLLKFLEEPNGQDTQAVLIVESIDRLLPTIVSRCQILPFKPLQANMAYNMAISEGMNSLDSYILSNLVNDTDSMKKIAETEVYQNACLVTERFVTLFDSDIHRFLIWLEIEILGKKDQDKDVFKQFIDIAILFFKDVVVKKSNQSSWFEKEVKRVSQKNYAIEKIILILLETRDKCNRSYNLQLLIEQMVYEIKEVI